MHGREVEVGPLQPEVLEDRPFIAAEVDQAIEDQVRNRRARDQAVGEVEVAAKAQGIQETIAGEVTGQRADEGKRVEIGTHHVDRHGAQREIKVAHADAADVVDHRHQFAGGAGASQAEGQVIEAVVGRRPVGRMRHQVPRTAPVGEIGRDPFQVGEVDAVGVERKVEHHRVERPAHRTTATDPGVRQLGVLERESQRVARRQQRAMEIRDGELRITDLGAQGSDLGEERQVVRRRESQQRHVGIDVLERVDADQAVTVGLDPRLRWRRGIARYRLVRRSRDGREVDPERGVPQHQVAEFSPGGRAPRLAAPRPEDGLIVPAAAAQLDHVDDRTVDGHARKDPPAGQ